MYSLKGIFPEPKKEQKKNFIRENMKQLKYIQGKAAKDGKLPLMKPQASRLNAVPAESSLGPIKSSPSNKSKITLHISKTSSINARKKHDIKIKKGDMAEFLKRKQLLKQSKAENDDDDDEEDVKSSESSGRLRDVGCQTIETNLAQKLEESAKLTMLYQKKDEREEEAKIKASGDQEIRHRSPNRVVPPCSRRPGGEELADHERPKNRLNSILERKEQKDPYLPPAGYQKGVLPKYLRERKEQGTKEAEGMKADDDQAQCPPGHVTLPDNERKETLRMLRNSFAELVSELNKMPVKTDTLRMRNRKMELEKQLAKLEEGIKVFSRPKVFVKIGE